MDKQLFTHIICNYVTQYANTDTLNTPDLRITTDVFEGILVYINKHLNNFQKK